MSEYFIPGATPAHVRLGQPFSIGAGAALVRYPGNWLALTSVEERAAIGAVAAPEAEEAQAIERDPAAGWVVRAKTADEFAAELAAARAEALAAVDAEAEARRRRHITAGDGQALIYAEKEREARDLAGGGAGPWPLLAAEADAVGGSVAELAATVLACAERWRAAAARIEGCRRGAKQALRKAGSVPEVRALLAQVNWPE